MKIAVIGSGYVGTTLSALLAASQYQVIAVDTDKKKVEAINSGKSPFYEKGLDSLISFGVSSGFLKATDDYSNLKDAEVVFSCVGTPDNPDGSSNLKYVFSAAESTAENIDGEIIFVQKSTVPVGTGNELIELFKKQNNKIQYASSPEFLREGSAIEDSLLSDRIVIGSDSKDSIKKIRQIYQTIQDSHQTINSESKLNIDKKELENHQLRFVETTLDSAELIKVTSNAFLALKISFANSIAKIADKSGADIVEVMDGVGYDKRIGRAFLNAGRGYGGGCFPKDVSGLIDSATRRGVNLEIMNAADKTNSTMPGYIINKAMQVGGNNFKDKKVAVLGLSFKAGTSDMRKSPAAEIANQLVHLGCEVHGYDPHIETQEAKKELNSKVVIEKDANTAIKNSEYIFVATDWDEFKDLNAKNVSELMSGTVVVDCMNSLDKNEYEAAGLKLIGVGR